MERSWVAGYPFRPTRSSQAMLNCQPCLDFDHPTFVIPAMRTVREPPRKIHRAAPE
jgi:hypothetical protein